MTGETGGQREHVDDLRQQLRSLGYLDAGVDRFVLGRASGARGLVVVALVASLRIGVLAAVLLGPASALWVSGRFPGLITGVRDAFVVAFYLGVLFGASIAIGAMVASLGVSWAAGRTGSTLTRRSRRLSIGSGALITILSLAYMTLWYEQARQGGRLAASGLPIALALAFSVAVSLLLGHAVTVTSMALVVARSGSGAMARGVPGASWRVWIGSAALAFCGAFLLFAYATSKDQETPSPTLTVVSSGLRIRLYAIDGFDPRLFDTLAAAGRIPALATAFSGARAILSPGASDRELDAALGRDPARTWTTVATGQPAARHGVQALETRRVAGLGGRIFGASGSGMLRAVSAATDLVRLTQPAIASGAERREKTFWEVAEDAGLKTVVVNWWATWPAASATGIVLSDRATLRLEHGGALDAEIAPRSIYERLRQRWPEIRAKSTRLAADALEQSAAEGENAALLRRSAELDATELALAAEVAGAQTDLAVTYLPGLDIAQHTLLGSGGGPGSAIAARLAALEDYYCALDRLLAPLVTPDSKELVMIVTAPGRVTAGANGRFVISGAPARPAEIAKSTEDVAPTVLYALGVPLSRELAGSPIVDLFSETFVRHYAVREVSTYGRPTERSQAREGRPLDQEMIDRLRSLGYVR